MITFVMVKFVCMKERLLEFLKAENKSSAQFAEEIGVQPSGISHILSGRNNPSLDFVLKMLEKYKFLSTEWLLFGTGSMYKENVIQSLFDDADIKTTEMNKTQHDNVLLKTEKEIFTTENNEEKNESDTKNMNKNAVVEKIVWFYNDNSFIEYFPSR
jgi:transcriptional regulator with XRE-family HTH domain